MARRHRPSTRRRGYDGNDIRRVPAPPAEHRIRAAPPVHPKWVPVGIRTRAIDWGEIWRTVEKISPEDWESLKSKLRQVYTRLDKLFHDTENWNDEDVVGAAMAIVVHTAYHLGEIRQALCTLK